MTQEKNQSEPKREESAWAQYGRYSHLALALPAGVVAGLILGAVLDRWLHTHWITLAGMIVGAIAGFGELIRALKNLSKEQ
jgi:F0F1-type ATP synthase assembly protein I